MDNNNEKVVIPSTSKIVENKKLEDNFLNITGKSPLSGKVIKNIKRLDPMKLKSLGINICLKKAISTKSDIPKVEENKIKVVTKEGTSGLKNNLSESITKRFAEIGFNSKLKSLTMKNQLVIEKVSKNKKNNINKSFNSNMSIDNTLDTFVHRDNDPVKKINNRKKNLSTSLPVAKTLNKTSIQSSDSEPTDVPTVLNKSVNILPNLKTPSKVKKDDFKTKLSKNKSKLETFCKDINEKSNKDNDDEENETTFYGFDIKSIQESDKINNERIQKINEFIKNIDNKKDKKSLLEQKPSDNSIISSNKTKVKAKSKQEAAEKSILSNADISIGKSPKRTNRSVNNVKNVSKEKNEEITDVDEKEPALITSTPLNKKGDRSRKKKIESDVNKSDIIDNIEIIAKDPALDAVEQEPALITSTPLPKKRGRKRKIQIESDVNKSDIIDNIEIITKDPALDAVEQEPALKTSTPPAKKRGRKRKIQIESDVIQSDIINNDEIIINKEVKNESLRVKDTKELCDVTKSVSKRRKLRASNADIKTDIKVILTDNNITSKDNEEDSNIYFKETSSQIHSDACSMLVESDSVNKESSKTLVSSKRQQNKKKSDCTDKSPKNQSNVTGQMPDKSEDVSFSLNNQSSRMSKDNTATDVSINDSSAIPKNNNSSELSTEEDNSVLIKIEKTPVNVVEKPELTIVKTGNKKIKSLSKDDNNSHIVLGNEEFSGTKNTLIIQSDFNGKVTSETTVLPKDEKIIEKSEIEPKKLIDSKRKSRQKIQNVSTTDKSFQNIEENIVAKNDTTSVSILESPESVEKHVSKRVGRPKKIKADDKSIDTNLESNKVENNTTIEATPEIQPDLSTSLSGIKRRGRQSKASLIACKIQESDENKKNVETTPVSKKRVQNKSVIYDESISDNDNVEQINNISIKKPATLKKNRQSLLIVNTPKPASSKNINVNPIICGNCKLTIEAADWDSHIFFHNGIAWNDEIDTPIVMTDYKTVLNTMINYMKANRFTQVKCEKCDEIRKSAIGLLGHKEICGLTDEEIENIKEKCPYCETRCRPSGLNVHVTNCSGLRQTLIEEKNVNKIENNVIEELTDAGRIKRKATTKVKKTLNIIIDEYVEGLIVEPKRVRITGGTIVGWKKQICDNGKAKCVNAECNFISKDIEEIRMHSHGCENIAKSLFTCRNCKFQAEEKNDVGDHIKEAHPYRSESPVDDGSVSESDASVGEESSDSEDMGECESPAESSDCKSDEDYDEEEGGKGTEKKRVRVKSNRLAELNLPTNPIVILEKSILSDYYPNLKISRSKSLYYTKSFKWTEEFRELNHSDLLYSNLLPDSIFIELSSTEVNEYLPHKKESLKYNRIKTNNYNISFDERKIKENAWSSLKCFEGKHDNETQTIFCGGPIISMEWAPLPDKNKDESSHQILAVCCKTNKNDFIHYYEKSPKKCLIQIWSFDLSSENSNNVPKLLYAIPYDDGYALDMKFCPSGCYDNELNNTTKRLGLLAVGSYYGEVNIFSLPVIENNENSSKFIAIEPSLVLITDICDPKVGNPVTKISWTQAKEHSKLVAGYVNGCVSVWCLNTKSILLRINEKTLLCNIIFQAHLLPIKALIIFYANNSRWIMTGSTDRKNKFYDLMGKPSPQLISKNLFKSQITCGGWFCNWTTYFVGLDECLAFRNGGIMYHQPLQFGNRTAPVISAESTITDMSCNDFLNIYITSMDSGDIYAGFPQQLLFNYLDKYIRDHRRVIGYTDYCQLNKKDNIITVGENPEMILDDKVINEEDYGLVFCDIDEPIKMENSSLGVKRMRRSKFNKYFLTKINQVKCNPNKFNCYHYAIGYETGLIRIRKLKNNQNKC